MNRRTFLAALASIPVIGRFVPVEAAEKSVTFMGNPIQFVDTLGDKETGDVPWTQKYPSIEFDYDPFPGYDRP